MTGECPVASHDIAYIALEQPVDKESDKPVTHVVKRALVFLEIGGGEAVAYDHVCALFQYHINQHGGGICRVGVISIYHDVAICFNLAEHGADDIAYTLAEFVAHNGSGFRCHRGSVVGAVVVVYVDVCIRELLSEIGNNFCNGYFFIIE